VPACGRQGAERRNNLNGEIATLPSVARNDTTYAIT